jgi:uncharacterized membrane-anchored protein
MSATDQSREVASPISLGTVMSKVPFVTAYFWIIKVLTTGMGEAASDGLVRAYGAIAVAVTFVVLTVSLVAQFRAPRYIASVYWFAVVMVAVFGTMAADIPHRIGLPLWLTSAAYFVLVLAIFAVWYRVEGTLSFDTISTRRREWFYWAAVLATFALGTAVGDLTASTWKLGYLVSGIMFALVIFLPVAAHRWLGLNSVAAFWIAYVLTRPLGASFADWMSASPRRGGLGLGAGPVALIWTAPILAFVVYVAVSRKDVSSKRTVEHAEITERH